MLNPQRRHHDKDGEEPTQKLANKVKSARVTTDWRNTGLQTAYFDSSKDVTVQQIIRPNIWQHHEIKQQVKRQNKCHKYKTGQKG